MSSLAYTDLRSADETRIRRWERIPPNAGEAVMFVHGATYGARSVFDPEGFSWLRQVAAGGRAAFGVDIRGYGDSERPPALDEPAGENSPVVRARTAARDVATALADVRETYDTVHLVGYSWGTIITGIALTELYVAGTSLVQYAPVYQPPAENRDRYALDDPPPAYRRVTRTEARERWADQHPQNVVPDDAFAAFWNALTTSGQRVDDDEILAPNGTLVDLQDAIETRLYDPATIDIPTLVVRGSLDTASVRGDALALYDALPRADRTYTEIADGTHFLQFEPNRNRLYETVRNFHEQVGETE